MYGPRDSWYDTAQVCLNGHTVNDRMEWSPQHSSKFCARCGAETVSQCEHCGTAIRGDYHVEGVAAPSSFQRPSFCYECGQPFPWTTTSLEAARELAQDLVELSDDERKMLSQSLDDLVRDTPRTPVASGRFKRVVEKVGSEGAQGLRDILIDIVSETAKRALWPS